MQVQVSDIKPMNTNINGETSVAKINMDGFAFQALSGKNLYKNVIRAIIRELSCNALDAHVMAGTEDRAFDIHLPTTFEPYFAVRDYGIGLDDYGVRNVYLTYFGSTKRNDNSQIGAWGLGSKSPLGYTDNFTVTAVKDGIERIYSVFKNEDGIPSISIICENPTDKHNGLEVRLAVVSDSDIAYFREQAADVLQWFKVKPNFNVDVAHEVPDNMITGLGGCIDVVEGSHLSKVVHGNIAYNLDSSMLGLRYDDQARRLASFGINLHMEHGTVEYSMSREELSYTERTVKNIVSVLKTATDDLVNKLAESFSGLHQYDAYLKLGEIKRLSFMGDDDYNELIKRGVSPLHLLQHDHFMVEKECHVLGVKMFRKYHGRRGGHNIDVVSMEPVYPSNVKNMRFFINNEKSQTSLVKKLKHNANKLSGSLVCIPPESVNAFVQLVKDKLDYDINVVSTDTLDALPKKANTNGSGSKDVVYRRLIEKPSSSWRSKDYGFEKDGSTFEPVGERYYVALRGYVCDKMSADTIKQLCGQFGINSSCVYGVSASKVSKLDSSWINWFDHIQEKVEEAIARFNDHGMQIYVTYKVSRLIPMIKGYDDVSLLEKTVSPQAIDNVVADNIKSACRKLGIDSPVEAEMDAMVYAVREQEEELLIKYPLLADLSSIHDSHIRKHAEEYIKMVNQL